MGLKRLKTFILSHSHLIYIIKFSTSDNAILAFWWVHCISVTSHYTCVWPHMEINAANVKLFVQSQVLSTKKWMRKETNSVSFLQKKYKKLRTIPSQKQRKGHIVQNENIQWYVSVKFPVESCKISNMNIEILRLHEDYVTTTIFTWMLPNGLLLLVAPNFWNR